MAAERPALNFRNLSWICGLTALALLMRLHRLGEVDLWFDEYMTMARLHGAPRLAAFLAEPSAAKQAMYYGFLSALGRLHPLTHVEVRLISALAGTAVVPLAFLIARRLAGVAVALTTAALLAISPVLVGYSQQARCYSLLMFLALLTTWLCLRARACSGTAPRPRAWWLSLALATIASVFLSWLHYSGLAYAAMLLLVMGLAALRRRDYRLAAALVGIGLATVVANLPLAQLNLDTLARRVGLAFSKESSSVDLLRTYRFFAWRPYDLTHTLLLIGSGGFGLHLWRRRRDLSRLTMIASVSVMVLVPFAALATLTQTIGPVFADRYLLAAFPPFVFLVAVGLVELGTLASPTYRRCALAVLVTIFGITLDHARGWTAGRHLLSEAGDHVERICRDTRAIAITDAFAPLLLRYELERRSLGASLTFVPASRLEKWHAENVGVARCEILVDRAAHVGPALVPEDASRIRLLPFSRDPMISHVSTTAAGARRRVPR